jgi:DNA-binding transcriptional LysR family regulator
MDRLTSMSVFVKVGVHQGFAAAARDLGLSRAGVSKHVVALEQTLGACLLNRNTRNVSLTEVGAIVHERYAHILDEIEEVSRRAGALQVEPRGVLRISAPISFGLTHLGSAVAEYMAEFLEVSVDVVLNDRIVDLIEEGFDAAIRIGHLPDSALVARRLAPINFVLCASPLYLARHSAPQCPSDLQQHNCVNYSLRDTPNEWRFRGPAGEVSVRISGRLKANNGNFLRVAAINGRGIGLAPTFLVGGDLAAGRLVPLMPEYAPVASELTIVYPHRRQLSAKVRSFVDFLVARFAGEPEWDGWPSNPPAAAPPTGEQSR